VDWVKVVSEHHLKYYEKDTIAIPKKLGT